MPESFDPNIAASEETPVENGGISIEPTDVSPSVNWELHREAAPVVPEESYVLSEEELATADALDDEESDFPRSSAWPPPRVESTDGPAITPPHLGAAKTESRPHVSIAAAVAVGAAAAFIGVGLGHFAWAGTPVTSNKTITIAPSGSGGATFSPFGGGDAGPSNPSGSGSADSNSAAVNSVASKVDPSLVDINTNLGYESASAAGTGIVLTTNGTILTNNHVIEGATQITATDIGNGKTYKATVVGYDRTHDVAVLQLQGASGLTKASLGTSKNVAVGQSVVGIGNAGGAGGTPSVAAGTVTGLNKSITATDASSSTSEQLGGLIQTDAPIQPGDSGGPLANMKGEVIAMDTAASQNYAFSGAGATSQGFSIPIDAALGIAHQILGGNASSTVHLGATGFLGVQIQPIGSTFNGATSSTPSAGVSVVGTISRSPAADAGLGQGDTILDINGTAVTSPDQMSGIISKFHPGSKVTLVWSDTSGTSHTTTLVLTKGPSA